MTQAREHPFLLTLISLLVSVGAAVAIAGAYGFRAFADAWSSPHWYWLLVAAGAALLAVGAYALSYRAAAAARGGPKLRWKLAMQAVMRGFAPFAARGGFAVDRRVLHAIAADERKATIRVLGLGALEWALLAPAAWLCAVVLLVVGNTAVMPSLVWPWAIAVPIGFALAFSLPRPGPRERMSSKRGRWWTLLARGLEAVEILRYLARALPTCVSASTGMALYWALDITSFYAALRFAGLRLDLGALILAYATGYALTRRSMPLGGAGITEVLMTFSVHWVGAPVLPALAAVLIYRSFNLALPALPALLVRPHIKPLLDAAERGPALASPSRRAGAWVSAAHE